MKTAKPDLVLTSPDKADVSFGADISVVSPDFEYLMIVEVKLQDSHMSSAIEQMKYLMASTNCSVGLVIAGERIMLFRDSLEEYNGISIYLVGEAKLPNSLLPSIDRIWQNENSSLEFLLRVRSWLENLKIPDNVDKLPNDLRALFSASIINLLRWGEVRAGSFRKIKTVK
jgi:hypothetical protein